MPSYSQLPTLFQWQKDSYVLIGSRAEDPVLSRIDGLVEALNTGKAEGEPMYLYGELFFATNYWLRNFKLNPKMKKERETAINNLFAFTAHRLAAAFGCTTATLPNELEKHYGKSMSAHGIMQDSAKVLGTHHYLQRGVANQFRILFRQGRAFQFEWRKSSPKLLPVESSVWYNVTAEHAVAIKGVRVLLDDWAMFAMSMSRDIYMGPHMTIRGNTLGKVAQVHSSWLAGTPVQCAGSMLIEGGLVQGIRNNSGHYQPTDDHMVNVLELLRTVGVNLGAVDVHDYEGRRILSGDEFLQARGNWDNILKRKGIGLPQPGMKPAPVVTTQGPGAKLKKKYRCGNCNRIYQETYQVTFCQYCRGACVPV